MHAADTIIIGAGLSGLAVAHFLGKHQPGATVLLLEASGRPGGAVESFQEKGFRAEWGPHGFLNSGEATMEILADTGLLDEALLAPLGKFVRYLCHRGRLVPLPQKPQQLLTTPLLTAGAKLRLLGDLFIRPLDQDQTIGDWAARRFGRGILHLVDAAVSGTFAGDYNRLSIGAVMPGLRGLEKEHGSVLRALKRQKKLKSGQSGNLPAMVNFPGGMGRLIEALAAGRTIRCRFPVVAVQPTDTGWEVSGQNGERLACRKLVVALPVNPALTLLGPLDAPPVQEIPYARLVNVVLGFSDRLRLPKAFGFLIPEREQRFTLGVMFSSQMFPGRCPSGTVLIEALVGGRRHPERTELDDEELISRVLDDITPLLGIDHPPVFARVLRTANTIPQLEMDHLALLAWRQRLLHRFAGRLAICGFGWDGIGMNDMTRAARKAATSLTGDHPAPSNEEQVKGVYF